MTADQLKSVRWIFFDWGGTLKDEFAIYRGITNAAIQHLGRSGSSVEWQELYDRLIEIERQETRIGLEKALQEFGVSPEWIASSLEATAIAATSQATYEGAEQVLEKLGQDFGLGVISNHRSGLDAVLEREGVRDYFIVVVGSGDFGVTKPDPSIFLGALEQADCEPHQAAMVGDRLSKDIEGANAAGLVSVRVRQGIFADEEPATPLQTPDFEVRSFDQLLELFHV